MDTQLKTIKKIFDYKANSYHAQRKCIGILGVALPVVLAIGKIFFDIVILGSSKTGIESSISSYYYTNMSGVFVGILCGIGIFLFSYLGPDPGDRRDNIAGNIACVSAVGVALFPTMPANPGPLSTTIATIHFASAATFLLTLAYFSIFLFTRTDPNRRPTRRKLLRNKIYRSCGWTIIITVILCIPAMQLPTNHWLDTCNPIFWLESTAVWAFGWSWLIKGEAILKDNE
ncbi:hypothetical protein [Pseudomonas fluorescens]|uniref:hypothetical protein n=1 Tax=Pseudomonas fluorescens TaxID=294 RepID=UPI001A9EC75E|nr:hypothetical protein [Pseudomonas fluorescens]QTD35839.1 hypothetical protein JZM58_13560 [Pseudomonas fluorescens]